MTKDKELLKRSQSLLSYVKDKITRDNIQEEDIKLMEELINDIQDNLKGEE
jgi:hypothetical protein